MLGTSVLSYILRYSDIEGDDAQCTCIIVTIISYTYIVLMRVRSLCNFRGISKCTKRYCNNIILYQHSKMYTIISY